MITLFCVFLVVLFRPSPSGSFGRARVRVWRVDDVIEMTINPSRIVTGAKHSNLPSQTAQPASSRGRASVCARRQAYWAI
jgi:hypothetical protein